MSLQLCTSTVHVTAGGHFLHGVKTHSFFSAGGGAAFFTERINKLSPQHNKYTNMGASNEVLTRVKTACAIDGLFFLLQA
jgi:hypothetical protein